MRIFVTIFAIYLLAIQPIIAALYYVRTDSAAHGTGSGADWTNAYRGLNSVNWGAVGAGDIIYVAGGENYTNFTQSDFNAGVAGNPAIVQRATVSDHGTDTGWSAAFDAQITFHPGSIGLTRVNFLKITGVTSNGISIQTADLSTGLGFIDSTGADNPCDGITIEYITVDGSVGTTDATKGMFLEVTNFVGRYLTFHSFYDDAIRAPLLKAWVIEHCIISNKLDSPSALHGDAVEMIPGSSDQGVDDGIFRYNYVDWSGDSFQLSAIGGQPGPGRIKIHDNIFTGNSDGGKAIKSNSSDPVIGPIEGYNNTFLGGNIRLMPNTTSMWTNNIFYTATAPTYDGTVTHDFNAYTGSNIYGEANGVALLSVDPFANSAGGDYSLASSSPVIGEGFNIGSEFATDFVSNVRSDPWAIGAYSATVSLIRNQALPYPIRFFKR